MIHADFRAQLLGNFNFQPTDVRILCLRFFGRLGGPAVEYALNQLLGLANREAFFDDFPRRVKLLRRVGKAEQRPGMTHVDLAVFQ